MDSKYPIVENDSREKSERDLDGCISTGGICRYRGKAGPMCKD